MTKPKPIQTNLFEQYQGLDLHQLEAQALHFQSQRPRQGAAKRLECKALWCIHLFDLPFQGYLGEALVEKGCGSKRFPLWNLFWQEMNMRPRRTVPIGRFILSARM